MYPIKNIILVTNCILLTVALHSQTSLWKNNKSPYRSNVQEGDLVEIQVNETFTAQIDSTLNNKKKLEIQLTPDPNNLPFLPSAEQSKNNHRQTTKQYTLKDKYEFTLQGTIGARRQDFSLYPISAQKTILINQKPTTITITGLIHPKDVKAHAISSRYIANLTISITTQEVKLANEIVSPSSNTQPYILDENKKKAILANYLQEIIELIQE